jgi:hypothetical protein
VPPVWSANDTMSRSGSSQYNAVIPLLAAAAIGSPLGGRAVGPAAVRVVGLLGAVVGAETGQR